MTDTDIVDMDYELDNSSFVADNCTCGHDGYLFRMRSYRPWVFHIGSANTVVIIIFNLMVIRAFSQKSLLSSATVPLIVLALCDILASIFMFWPNELGFILRTFHFNESQNSDVFLYIYKINYPFCIFSQISYYLGHVSHSSSLLLTSLVAVQKALVIQFPLWSKVYLMRRVILSASLLIVFLTFCLNSSLVFYTVYPSNDQQSCCRKLDFVKKWNAFQHKQILFVCYIICFITLMVSSIYIAFSLTCRRRSKNDTRVLRKRHRRSAVIVILIACFCIITEFIPFCCRSSFYFKQLCSNEIHQFELLVLQFGFTANFLIYIVMSQKLRSNIMCCRSKTSWELEHPRQSRSFGFTSLTSLNCTSTHEKENGKTLRAPFSLNSLNRHSIEGIETTRLNRINFCSMPSIHQSC